MKPKFKKGDLVKNITGDKIFIVENCDSTKFSGYRAYLNGSLHSATPTLEYGWDVKCFRKIKPIKIPKKKVVQIQKDKKLLEKIKNHLEYLKNMKAKLEINYEVICKENMAKINTIVNEIEKIDKIIGSEDE
jgi:hypothetical protein